MHFKPGRCFLLACVCLFALSSAPAESGPGVSPTPLTAEQIVAQMQRHDQMRTAQLQSYASLRHYRVEYHGFFTNLAADLAVEVRYNAATGKSFQIVSQSGSRLLVDDVLKRAVDSEKEAATDKRSTALTPANYRFQLEGGATLQGRPVYLLDVEPIKPSKFLYQGKIWVDAADFAVVQIEATPAQNPSFWIKRTLIHFESAKTCDFWLPARNRSETRVRIGGTAVLTIDYGSYRIASAAEQQEPKAAPCE